MDGAIKLEQVQIPGEAHLYIGATSNGFRIVGYDCAVRGRDRVGMVIEWETGWHDCTPSTDILDYIANRAISDYAPIALQAVDAYNAGDKATFRALAREAKDALKAIAHDVRDQLNS